jgi:hypothetical protein
MFLFQASHPSSKALKPTNTYHGQAVEALLFCLEHVFQHFYRKEKYPG